MHSMPTLQRRLRQHLQSKSASIPRNFPTTVIAEPSLPNQGRSRNGKRSAGIGIVAHSTKFLSSPLRRSNPRNLLHPKKIYLCKVGVFTLCVEQS